MTFFPEYEIPKPKDSTPGLVIVGNGAIGRALANECQGKVRLVGRNEKMDFEVNHAVVTWPAHLLVDRKLLEGFHPELSGVEITTLCNGAWVPKEVGVQGCAYVRADKEEYGGPAKWRVGSAELARKLRDCGADVTASRPELHRAYVWGKALYLVPLALACGKFGTPAKQAARTALWSSYFDKVLEHAIMEISEESMVSQIKRAQYLVERLPNGWTPSPSQEELVFFQKMLGLSF